MAMHYTGYVDVCMFGALIGSKVPTVLSTVSSAPLVQMSTHLKGKITSIINFLNFLNYGPPENISQIPGDLQNYTLRTN